MKISSLFKKKKILILVLLILLIIVPSLVGQIKRNKGLSDLNTVLHSLPLPNDYSTSSRYGCHTGFKGVEHCDHSLQAYFENRFVVDEGAIEEKLIQDKWTKAGVEFPREDVSYFYRVDEESGRNVCAELGPSITDRLAYTIQLEGSDFQDCAEYWFR